MNNLTEKVLETNSHYFLKVKKLLIEHFYLGPCPIIWSKFAKNWYVRNARDTKKLHLWGPACVALKNLIDHFVPYNPLSKLSVHHNSLGSIFFELHGENWIFVKIRKNFSFTSHSERKNDVAQKILTPRSYDGQIICSVDCREQNGILSFWMLPMVWAAGPVSGTFRYLANISTDNFFLRIS